MDLWGLGFGVVVFAVQEWRSRRQQQDLKEFISDRGAYDEDLLRRLEDRGRIKLVRDADTGDVIDVQIPAKTITGGFIDSEAEVYGATVSLGPPPAPPRHLGLGSEVGVSAHLGRRVIRRDGTVEDLPAE